MRCQIVAELATGHGGDLQLAEDMILAAADSGADLVKLQTYSLSKLNPADPQVEWLRQAHLDQAAHERLIAFGQARKVEVFSTPFDAESLQMLRGLYVKRFKVASSESGNDWWQARDGEQWIVSWPWGVLLVPPMIGTSWTHLAAIPLYPTPLEAVGRARRLMGWSDHTEGTAACQMEIAHGATMVEVHFCLPGRSRQKGWDKTPEDVRALRTFAEACATMQTGVSQTFRERWSA